MLYKLPVTIETLSPIILSEQSGDNVMTGTIDYIGGSTLRGALANMYVKQLQPAAPEKDKDFFQSFLSGKLHFLPCYPTDEAGNMAAPLPLSLQKDKDGKELLDLTVDNTKIGYKGLKGFGVVKDGQIRLVSVKKLMNLHMSRNSAEERIVGRSQDGHIYNYEAICAGQSFKGSIVGEKEELEQFKSLLSKLQLDKEGTLYLGRSKHTQYGKCSVVVGKPEAVGEAIEKTDKSVFLRAMTDYLPSNTCFDAATSALEEIAQAIAQKLQKSIELGRIFSSVCEQEGFVAVWGIKRAKARGLAAGTLVELKADSWSKEELTKLQELAMQGFGKRCGEGFGAFTLWQPLTKKAATPITTAANNKIVAPKVFSPAVKKVVEKVVRNLVVERLQRIAAADIAKRFEKGCKCKHSLARLEAIITGTNNKGSLKAAIIEEMRPGSPMVKHFEAARVNNVNLKEIFEIAAKAYIKPDEEKKLPYLYHWNEVVDADLKALIKEVGLKEPDKNSDLIYKIYWLWYCRQARKYAVKEGGSK